MAVRSPAVVRLRVMVSGVIQGVGFRPFIHRLATSLGLAGTVANTAQGVVIEIEGPASAVTEFTDRIEPEAPPLCALHSLHQHSIPVTGETGFQITTSRGGSAPASLIPHDAATCADCLADIRDPASRYHLYPFTNCTACGPRYSIVTAIPYDREQTAMAAFPMCPDCGREYGDPTNRRFHAQPVACPACGPTCEFVYAGFRSSQWREETWAALSRGQIVAIKGLGGFHLVCDAKNPEAIATLRTRKRRPARPFAVMCPSVDAVHRYCHLTPGEQRLLTSPRAPIVILDRKPDSRLPESLAPGLDTLGVMLPYTPLHHLLLDGPFDTLVMTSGNLSGQPLIIDNRRAFESLTGIADSFVVHDRAIHNRIDDSVVAVCDSEPVIIRRSRGYVPEPIPLDLPASMPPVLGIGGEMKNAVCIVRGGQAIFSQHNGEIGTVESEQALLDAIAGLQQLLGVTPEAAGYDLHPGYRSSALAQRLPVRLFVPVQHHHAHLVSCLAEHRETGPAIGAILDGAGYGTDGAVWGFEFLIGDDAGCHRACHLDYVPQPGGDLAAHSPWRMAVSHLLAASDHGREMAASLYGDRPRELAVVIGQIDSGFNSPPTSSCGRLFDAVSSLLGICHDNTYEGQAAIELERWARAGSPGPPCPYRLSGDCLSLAPTIQEIAAGVTRGEDRASMARRFQDTVAHAVATVIARLARETGIRTIVLAGGTWQNRHLLTTVTKMLEHTSCRVLTSRQLPAGDGGLALGQAFIAARSALRTNRRHRVQRPVG